MLQNNRTPGPVVAKEAFYPTGGTDPIANPQNQIAWYGTYAVHGNVNGQPSYFVWGEAFDQPWKISIDSYEPHMGLNAINNPDGTANPKPIIGQLAADITGTYVPPGMKRFEAVFQGTGSYLGSRDETARRFAK